MILFLLIFKFRSNELREYFQVSREKKRVSREKK